MKDHKKLNIDDRMIIQGCLYKLMNITQIAKRLKVSKSTISRELSRNCIVNKGYNKTCLYSKTHVVCNTCPKKGCCSYTRKFYNFEHADMLAKERSSGSRSFARINPNDLKFVNLIVSNGVNLGQSIHHVYNANPCLKDICCERTIRRYVYKRLLDVKAYDLRRFIRFKHEYKRKDISAGNRDLSYLIDRSYKDFVKMTSAHKSFSIVEFDSVIGKIDDKQAILTITLKKENFQFGILIRKGNSNDVAKKVRLLFRRLGSKMANKIFRVCLCDNGTEFSNFTKIELDSDNNKIVNTFYTRPYTSSDKATCERLHEILRYVLPKGKSLNNLTQEQLDDIYSNINSYVRKSKDSRTPYELVKRKFGEKFLNVINIKKIQKKEVKLLAVI